MADKILLEAFDKLKAIEESDDPFCIGATGDTDNTTGYTAVEESVTDWAQPKSYETEDDNGHHYAVHFQDEGGLEQAIIEIDGITVAHYSVGGAGSQNAQIKDADKVLDALTSMIMSIGHE